MEAGSLWSWSFRQLPDVGAGNQAQDLLCKGSREFAGKQGSNLHTFGNWELGDLFPHVVGRQGGSRVGAGCLAPFSYTKLFQLHFVCIVLSQILPWGCWALGWTFVGRKQGLLLISITAAMGPGCCCFLPVREADEEILGQGCWPPWPRIQLPFSLFFPVVDAHSDHIEKLMEAWLPGCLE